MRHRRHDRHVHEAMQFGGGQTIQPTGKRFSIPMCTVGHWKNGVMIEESLFWDNATYMSQLGVKMKSVTLAHGPTSSHGPWVCLPVAPPGC